MLADRQAVGVIDQNLSPGLGGILYHEIASALATRPRRPAVLRSFIGGLGGKDISQSELEHVWTALDAPSSAASDADPAFLFTQEEWQQVQQRLEMAGKPLEATTT